MAEILTKSCAHNICDGGSIFFVVVFVTLTVQSHRYVVSTSTSGMELSDVVVHGKHIWEIHSCINCHSLHGEGAYLAPELENVMTPWGVQDSPEDAFDILKGWIESQPNGIAAQPQLSDEPDVQQALRDLVLAVYG
ncbi:c-type cytochrome [Ruegeria profundi]|uniref:Cytochrome C n=1 Tax=Ruegeria profundi TaxID=1685378 RepID=A0A0X3U2Z6_9RHOB|nr:c-type cytochrome [Ruegeria profundi]KUJ81206.1 cytochrome C [Ruegeria profundi]